MVSHAFDLLTSQQKKYIKNMTINYTENKITIVLRSSRSSEKLKIEYKRAGSATTINAMEKLIHIDDNFVNVFCEDLEEFLMYQKSFLQFFGVQFDRVDFRKNDYRPNKLVPIVSMISETLEHLLKSRKYTIQVKRLFLEFVDVAQVISILNQLDLSILRDAVIVFELGEGPIHLEELLDKISKPPNLRKLSLRLNKLTAYDLEVLNKHRATSPFFQKFSISYKEIEDECFLLKLPKGLIIDKIFLQTPSSKKFKINFCNSDFDDNLHIFLGSPYAHLPGIRTIWYFQTVCSEKWLHIILHERKTVIFSIVQQDLIPEGLLKII
ncbi:unnamed protein product [Caenorhabditis nigoni]